MRFDARAVSLATYFAILLFNVYTLVLYFNQQLALYTNPRYVWFTAIFNAISAVACAAGIILTAWRMGRGSIGGLAVPWRPSFTLLVAGLVLVAAYALPARTLSSDIAEQRSDNFNSTQVKPSGSDNTLALFGTDTARLTIADWVSAFNLKTSPSFYTGKKVDVVGFVFHPKSAPSHAFYVSRLRVTC